MFTGYAMCTKVKLWDLCRFFCRMNASLLLKQEPKTLHFHLIISKNNYSPRE